MNRAIRALVITLSSFLFVSCSVNPVTGKNELSLISGAQEIAIGEQNYAPSQQAQGGRYYIDPEVEAYVAEVGNKLAAVSDRPDLPYEFVVLNNSVPNAWALPGGKIAINRGLLTHLEDESELAAVLGHEIVHAAARHSAAQMTRGTLIGVGAQILAISLADSSYSPLANTAIQIGSAAWMARYGRSAELESDAYGMEYMSQAGYDPQGAVKLQQTFVKLSEGKQSDFVSGLFASHPPSQDRVDANRERALSLPSGENYANRYQAKMKQIRKDEPAYKAQEEAIKALKKKNSTAALKYLDKAISIQPADGYFWELRGHAHKMQKNYPLAEKDFTTAITKNPELFSHYLARGMLRYEHGSKSDARSDLQKSHQLLPTQAASFLLGELSLADNDQSQAIQYYQSAAQGGGDLGKQALGKITRLELPQSPHKYILSQAYLTDKGYLMVAIKNSSGIAVENVQVRIDQMSGPYSVSASATLSLPGEMQPGEQRSLKTGVGPIDSVEQANNYRTQVITAHPKN